MNVFYLSDFNLTHSTILETGCDNVKFIILQNNIKCIEVVQSIVCVRILCLTVDVITFILIEDLKTLDICKLLKKCVCVYIYMFRTVVLQITR